jgi:hypothetical protein
MLHDVSPTCSAGDSLLLHSLRRHDDAEQRRAREAMSMQRCFTVLVFLSCARQSTLSQLWQCALPCTISRICMLASGLAYSFSGLISAVARTVTTMLHIYEFMEVFASTHIRNYI